MKRALRGLPPVSSLPLAAGAEGSKSSGEQEASSAGYLDEIDHLIFLGTGAAAPSRLRSCSGILVSIPSCRTKSQQARAASTRILLDCGEGCLSRLMQIACNIENRKAEKVKSQEQDGEKKDRARVETEVRSCPMWRWHDFVMEIKLIWISHMHADHHSGLLSLLFHRLLAQECEVCRREKKVLMKAEEQEGGEEEGSNSKQDVLIIGPHALKQVVERYHQIIRGSARVSAPLVCKHFTDCDRRILFPSFLLRSFPVFHSPDAHAAVLRFRSRSHDNDGVILTYSGDTRPSMQLVEETMRMVEEEEEEEERTRKAGGGEGRRTQRACVMLIHEATFDSDQLEHAKRKRHSTVGEAIQVGEQLRDRLGRRLGLSRLSYGTVLSHFSQRYPNILSLDLSAGPLQSMTGNMAGPSTNPTISSSPSPSASLPSPPVMLAFDGLYLPLEFERMRQVFDRSGPLLDRLGKVKEAMRGNKEDE